MADYSKDFCDFWALYGAPRNASKADSWKAWNQKSKSRPRQELMLASVQSYNIWLSEEQAKNKNGFPAKCHPATWIRGERWEGYLDTAEAILRAKDGHSLADRSASAKSWDDAWDAKFEALEQAVGKDAFRHWFLATTISQSNGRINIDCPSKFFRGEMIRRFATQIRDVLGRDVQLTVLGKN
jgi:hypothetical protein